MKAWHFLKEDKKLGYTDGRLVRVGHTFKCDPGSLKMCESGFHASVNILDALKYAPGPIICRVELGGKVIRSDDKCVASERTVISMIDATDILHEFACWSAERALKRIENPDSRSIKAIEVKRKWLRGGATDKQLAAARDAARDAARAAAWAASWAAAWAASWAAERKAQSRKLSQMVLGEMK